MAFIATWMKGDEIVDEDVFADLLEAKTYVLEHLAEKQKELGATAVEVCDDGKCAFKIECPSAPRSA